MIVKKRCSKIMKHSILNLNNKGWPIINKFPKTKDDNKQFDKGTWTPLKRVSELTWRFQMLCISTLVGSCYLKQLFSQKIWEQCDVFVLVAVCSIWANAVSSVSIFLLLDLVFFFICAFLPQHSISSNSFRKLSFSQPYRRGLDTALDMPNMWHTA